MWCPYRALDTAGRRPLMGEAERIEASTQDTGHGGPAPPHARTRTGGKEREGVGRGGTGTPRKKDRTSLNAGRKKYPAVFEFIKFGAAELC